MEQVQDFLSKNIRWVTIIFVFLFLIKSIQSCNRNVALNMDKKEYINAIDSLDNVNSELVDSIKYLNYELKMANKNAESANQRADAVSSAVKASKTNSTTTIVVKGQGIEEENNK